MAQQPVDAATVSAEVHQRLEQSYAALNDQFDAANEVLVALGRSAADPDTVLTTIVESARRLCQSQAAHVYLLEDGIYRLIKAVGLSRESAAFIAEHPMPMDRDTLIGRVGLDRTTQQIPDVLADPEYGRKDLQRVAHFRTTMAAPLLVDDEVVGSMSVWRNEVSPFDSREMAIVTAFAAQAAMAINGVRLVQELEARRADLARKVEELEALREVGDAVGSSLDVDHVLSTIAMHAVELSGTDGGSIMEYYEQDHCFRVRATYQTAPTVIDQLRSIRIELETLVGRAAKERTPLAVTDLGTADLDPHLRILYESGWRSVLAVPMLREEQIVGALVVRRKRAGGFSEEIVEMLETFASQSAIALLNARLFSELEKRSAELEVASTHKSEFLASMSHELRTPLNAVLGFSEVLLEQMFGTINERQEEYLRDIHGSGKHLLELLNEILDLSKVEAGQMELEYARCDLVLLLHEAASMLRERAGNKSVDIVVEADGDVGSVEADELRLRQVLINLLTNAVKFTDEGGSVVLRVARADPMAVTVTVTDTGIGVAPDDRERIFESFQQGGRGASREEGTGLGLTLSRRIIELLGGRMWLESEVGVGSTFGFTVPVDRRSVAGWVDEPGSGSTVTDVVVIDDDRPSLDLLTAYLAGGALRVTPARDGPSGLDAVRRIGPAVVLLDIRLPGMDGWAVLEALKADATTRDIPVIVVSIVDEYPRGATLGAAAQLVKPVSRDSLLDALHAVGVPTGRAEPVPSEVAT